MKIAGSHVFITGANGGIGGALARLAAQRGARLTLLGRDATRMESMAEPLRILGARSVTTLSADLADPGTPARVIDEAMRASGDIDILINCAGVQHFGFFTDEPATTFASVFNINTLAPMALTHAVLPHMLDKRFGRIVNVGSIFGSIGFPCFASYSASKYALRGFSEALRRELAGTGVGVTYVAPRFTRTPFNNAVVSRMADALKMNQDDPESVAADVIATIEANGTDRYLGWPEKLFVRINAIFPRLVDGSLMKQVDQMRPFASESRR